MAGTYTYSAAGTAWGKPKTRLDRMLHGHGECGFIRFKYYGDFEFMKGIYEDCKDDLSYVGNSKIDGSPVFVYNYDDVKTETIRDFKALNLILRKIKIKHYSKKELTKEEQSLFSFFKFFMIAHDNYEIKGLGESEINQVSFNTL